MKEKIKKVKEKVKKERVGFFAEFKAFITKGNVLDLAVAVVIGAAFGKITSGLVNYIITPLTSLFLGDIDLSSVKTILRKEVLDAAGEVAKPEVALQWGLWLQTIIDFLIIALCVFIILRLVRKAESIVKAKEIAAKAEAEAKAKAEADAKAAEEAARAEALKAREDEFYANVKEQTELLRKLAEK